jgi:hypothetical protein
MARIQFQDKYISLDAAIALGIELRASGAKLLRLNGGEATRPAKILACDPVVEYDERQVAGETIQAIMRRYGFSERS